MLLYRTSNFKRRNSLSFLANPNEQTALLAQLEKRFWIDQVFRRPLPIPREFHSRFGPPGYFRNVFYSSTKRETTFFEYGYGLLKAQSIVGRGIAALCFEVDFQPRQTPIDVIKIENHRELLNPNSYSAAHQWLLALSSRPESIYYPSVRDPSGDGANFAIYERHTITGTRTETEQLVLTPQSSGWIDIESLATGERESIQPSFY